ncbi:GGDEF domain-containing protein [Roseateles sp.]|uniref:GGDEF domain-containing protein n=1 Tax=Roseateles sp. TaxID=1971397 RepID=UPI003BA9D9AE
MDFLDTPTVLVVSAVFNAMAALAWLLLAQVFHIAPTAGRLMAAAHLTRILSQGCGDCLTGWPARLGQALSEYGTLASIALLLLALRRMLRSRRRPQDIVRLTVLGAAGMTAGFIAGSGPLPHLVGATAIAALAVLAAREVVRGVARQLSRTVTAFMAVPFFALAAVSVLNVLELATSPDRHLIGSALPPPWRAVLWFLLSAAITLSFMSLMIWRLITRIQQLMRNDALTGTLNRRAFGQALAEHQALLLRGHGFAIVMMDIDHFKRVNDQHGHAAGDAALQHAVRLWRAELRDVDVLGRLGGEEFCALLPLGDGAGIAAATLAAERLRAALAAAPLAWQGRSLPLTASFGVALPQPRDATGGAGLASADAQVYRAKAAGRNRVCVAAPPGRANGITVAAEAP